MKHVTYNRAALLPELVEGVTVRSIWPSTGSGKKLVLLMVFVVVVVACYLLYVTGVNAQESTAEPLGKLSILPTADATTPGSLAYCIATGDCTVCNMMQVGVRIVQIILSLSGAAVLVMLIYGGVRWMTAAGNTKGIDAGKAALRNAAIGLVIIVGAWMLINLTIGAIT